MKREVTLDYTLEFGALAPYITALGKGEALASACQHCGFTAYPARLHCPKCASSPVGWKPLSGRAQIVHRTAGPEHAFALVQFEGADTRSVVRLHAIPPHVSQGCLIAPRDELPGLWLGANASDARKED